MEKKIDISVVIATYGRPALLTRCLEVLALQSFPRDKFEVVVVTDGPDSNTIARLTSLEHTFPYHLSFHSLPKKSGPAAARNLGWRLAKGELIAFTDDDCLPSKEWLADYWMEYSQSTRKDLALVGTVKVPISFPPTDYEKNVSRLETASFITANCACNREALEKVGGLDEDFKMAWREDSALEFNLRQHEVPIIHIKTAQVTHPVRKASWGASLRDQKKCMFNALLYKKYPEMYEEEVGCRPPWFYYAIVFYSALGVLSAALCGITSLIFLSFAAGFVVWFALMRLSDTSKSPSHIAEMAVTSALIPFLSVFWNVYGAIKYRTMFL